MGQPEPKAPMRATRWIAGLAVLLLVGGLAAAVRSRRQAETATVPAPAAPAAEASPEDEAPATEAAIPDDDVHRKALEGHSDKSKWVEEVPGLDVSDLRPQQRDVFLSAANSQRCTCGCGYTLAGCRVYDSSCEKSGPRVAALLDSVRAGQVRDATGLRSRPPHPG
jgi:hypothetical protein